MESVEMLSLKKNNTASSALQLVDDSNTTRKVMHYALKPGEILCLFEMLPLDYRVDQGIMQTVPGPRP